ncbi:hypothetical protein, partial [Longimicrobium sp.]|uniref:hypothetical protein n=1 Tax=Longimicrobium sp. TaxID=2029185 RepID=UPI002F93DE1A
SSKSSHGIGGTDGDPIGRNRAVAIPLFIGTRCIAPASGSGPCASHGAAVKVKYFLVGGAEYDLLVKPGNY